MSITYNRKKMGATYEEMDEFVLRLEELGLPEKLGDPNAYFGIFDGQRGRIERIVCRKLGNSKDPDLEEKIDRIALEVFGPRKRRFGSGVNPFFKDDKFGFNFHGIVFYLNDLIEEGFVEDEEHRSGNNLETLCEAFSGWLKTLYWEASKGCEECSNENIEHCRDYGLIFSRWWRPNIFNCEDVERLISKGMIESKYFGSENRITAKGLNYIVEKELHTLFYHLFEPEEIDEAITKLRETYVGYVGGIDDSEE